MLRLCPVLILLVGCGSASPAPVTAEVVRHADLVEALVIRSLTVEDGELDPAQRRLVRTEAVQIVAEAMRDLDELEVRAVRLDVNLAEVTESEAHVRARCLVTVSTAGPPERTRSVLQGAASAPRSPGAPSDDHVRASSGAIRSALRGLPAALRALD